MSPSDELRELLDELPAGLRVWMCSLLGGDEPELTETEWRTLRPALIAAAAGEREYRRAEACAAWHRAAVARWAPRWGCWVTWATALVGAALARHLVDHNSVRGIIHGALISGTSLYLGCSGVAHLAIERRRDRAHRRSFACVLGDR